MFWLVTFLGTLRSSSARNYHRWRPRQSIFLSRLYLTIQYCVLFLIAVQQVICGGWFCGLGPEGFALHQLLVFYPLALAR
jgi:hypothetical protein